MCFLSNNIYDYFNVSQGKITIPNVDDGEECMLADVSRRISQSLCSVPHHHHPFQSRLNSFFCILSHNFFGSPNSIFFHIFYVDNCFHIFVLFAHFWKLRFQIFSTLFEFCKYSATQKYFFRKNEKQKCN